MKVKKSSVKEKLPVVSLTIRGIGKMSKEERIKVGTWLHDWGITMIIMDKPEQYAATFKATYR